MVPILVYMQVFNTALYTLVHLCNTLVFLQSHSDDSKAVKIQHNIFGQHNLLLTTCKSESTQLDIQFSKMNMVVTTMTLWSERFYSESSPQHKINFHTRNIC